MISSEPSSYFPFGTPRDKQLKALSFIKRAVEAGYRDIVVEAPCGVGKSLIGLAASLWLKADGAELDGQPGAYYLVGQKLLQDQLERDFELFQFGYPVSLKSSCEYVCPNFKKCSTGMAAKKPCVKDDCAYKTQRAMFYSSDVGVTNYAYFLTERLHVGKLKKRRLMVFDECHSLERTIIRFVDVSVSQAKLKDFASELEAIPDLKDLQSYVDWLSETYLPSVKRESEIQSMLAESGSDDAIKKSFDVLQHYNKVKNAVELIEARPDNWIYWSAQDKDGNVELTARPLEAGPYTSLLRDMGEVRLYMSAYPGEKGMWCRSLGLDPSNVAWCRLNSDFPVENRRVIVGMIGSMSRANQEASLPNFKKALLKIVKSNASSKGLIHCVSYALGRVIYDTLAPEFGHRLIFPQNGDDREGAFKRHCESSEPTVIITPSMTEGFDFAGDLARWQILAKCPYPSLGDAQLVAKKERDPDFYPGEAIKSTIQSVGRIVRSSSDHGITYLLDSDFDMLFKRYQHFFPKWFMESLYYPKRS